MKPEPAGMPQPPYYAVIFTSQRSGGDEGYEAMAERMAELTAQQPGFLGMQSARDAQGFGITVCYWESLEAVAAWRGHVEHRLAQELGRKHWYARFETRIARVERCSAGP